MEQDNNSEMDVLIIEDDDDISFLLGLLCERKTMKFIAAKNLTEATYLLKWKPRLCFLDNNLPDGTGLEFIKTIRASYKGIVIIMLTAQDIDITKKAALENGANYFIEKPFLINDINQILDKVFIN